MESSLYSELHNGSEKLFHRDILREVIDSIHHFIREKFQMKPVFIFNDGMRFNDEGFIYWENIKFSAMRNGEPYTIEIDSLAVNTMLNIASGGRYGFIMKSWSEKKDSVETVAHHLGKEWSEGRNYFKYPRTYKVNELGEIILFRKATLWNYGEEFSSSFDVMDFDWMSKGIKSVNCWVTNRDWSEEHVKMTITFDGIEASTPWDKALEVVEEREKFITSSFG